MTTMARTSTGLAYPDRFYAAASYAGLDGSLSSNNNDVSSRFSNEVALILYALYQQATIGPCDVPKPSSWNPVEQSKWKSWQQLGNMATTEAMRLFVKILEEEDPGWYSRASNFVLEPTIDVQMNTISAENGSLVQTQDKDVISEGLGSVVIYDTWISPPITGQHPKARYQHGAAVVQEKMYIYGGNHNGRYLGDLHVLDFRSWTWSNVGTKAVESPSPVNIAPCAAHSLIPWGNKLLSIAGHMKDPSETIQVKAFDLQTGTWSMLKTYGKPPVSRGGQSVNLVGTTLVIFGGQGANRTLLNDLYILDLETMTWDEIDVAGVAPSPRSDHAAAVHAERYLLVFGGSSHATFFNDLHVLDLQTMEWSKPAQLGELPTPRAGHAGVTIGENWFIAGGGDNKSGASKTIVLNMSSFVWSVVTSVEGTVPLASEVNILNPSCKLNLQSNITEAPSAVHNATNPTRDLRSEFEIGQGKIREIVMDNVDSKPTISECEKTNERIIATLKVEEQELESSLSEEKLQSLQLKQQVLEAETRNTELYKELQSVRGQLGTEQSRCFKLEVEVAELRQKLQTMETLEKELEFLQRLKAASEQAALNAKQRQGSSGVWGWLAGNPPEHTAIDDNA
ncbi:hypothetical protein ES332_A11G333400v1 [Gossypium tomentosum]|uniref:ACB domain-containing protein n=1 Tax=Gossypium tomentosum TaxID=34277 RepID=A0A5D2NJ34_GOSTO|nr:hypothetical protein ES332_A11G333400v1 [Gossypium tomentosum]